MTDQPNSIDEAAARGKYGPGTDQTPDENYTVRGVLAGKPTPETDPDMRQQLRAADLDKQTNVRQP
ncbi:hypothetical protein [Streptomyces sp. NPDC003710]